MGFRVMGTTNAYLEHFRYANKRPLEINQGRVLSSIFETVIGADVAKKLGYKLGDGIVLAHGVAATSFTKHDKHPFKIVGILRPTGTPVDHTVHVRLDGIEAIHKDWQTGRHLADLRKDKPITKGTEPTLKPAAITAFMVGLKSKLTTFSFQRKVNQFQKEPLLAILPGVALTELWQMIRVVENIFVIVSWLVLGAALIGLSTMMLATLRERKHEFFILRALGARPIFILICIQIEALMIIASSLFLALCGLCLALVFSQSMLVSNFGVYISPHIFNQNALLPIGSIFIVGIMISLLPAITAYRESQ